MHWLSFLLFNSKIIYLIIFRIDKPLDREALVASSGVLNLRVRASELINGQPGTDDLSSTTAEITITIRQGYLIEVDKWIRCSLAHKNNILYYMIIHYTLRFQDKYCEFTTQIHKFKWLFCTEISVLNVHIYNI